MVPIPPQTQAVERHIPAWKKLGLRLKYAKEELSPSPAIPNGTPSTITNEKKRKLPPEILTDTLIAKKPKKSKPKSKNSENDLTTNPASSPQPLKSFTFSPIELRESKRRSVSFTPATKAHDGEGVKEYIKRWSTSHPERAERLRVSEPGYFQSESGTEAEREEGSATEPKKKKKKKKKSKSTTLPLKPASGIKTSKLPASGPTGTQSAPSKALQYLEHHQTSPLTWKFSKSRQNSLFRSLFSLIEIPSSYDSALLAYLRGLSRTAAATIRVRNMALDVRKGDEEWTKKEEGQQDGYARFVEKMRAGLRKGNLEDLDMKEEGLEDDEVKRKEWEEKLRKRKRAEVILFAVGDQADPTPPPTPVPISASIAATKPTKTYLNSKSPGPSTTTTTTTTTSNNNKPQPHPTAATTTSPFVKPKRKRKTRTLAFSSSSSSSSSSESSSSESDREKKATKPTIIRKKLVWDTTSSDDDDSSSSASG